MHTVLGMSKHALHTTVTALALSIGLGAGCASRNTGAAIPATTATPALPESAPTPARWQVRPHSTADAIDRAFLAGDGAPITAFITATQDMRSDDFYGRDRCIDLTQRTLPTVANDINELLRLAAMLRNESFRDAVTMNLKVKNAALIVCSSGREVGVAGRDVIDATTESIEQHIVRLTQSASSDKTPEPAGVTTTADVGCALPALSRQQLSDRHLLYRHRQLGRDRAPPEQRSRICASQSGRARLRRT